MIHVDKIVTSHKASRLNVFFAFEYISNLFTYNITAVSVTHLLSVFIRQCLERIVIIVSCVEFVFAYNNSIWCTSLLVYLV